MVDNTDCDDTDPGVNPGADEALNGVDDNCNDQIDEGISCEIGIMGIKTSNISSSKATISWITDIQSIGYIHYSADTDLANYTTISDVRGENYFGITHFDPSFRVNSFHWASSLRNACPASIQSI